MQSLVVMCGGFLLLVAGCPSSDATTQPADDADRAVARVERDDDRRSPDAGQYISPQEVPGRVHTVQRGDTLYSLAQRYYGSGQSYYRILTANRQRLKDPNNLPVGMKLIIPP